MVFVDVEHVDDLSVPSQAIVSLPCSNSDFMNKETNEKKKIPSGTSVCGILFFVQKIRL
jgi:hypothetical protein